MQGWTALKASKCLLCHDVNYSRSLYFSVAPQILIFMNVPLPVFELLHSQRHCTVSRHSFFKLFHSNEWMLCALLHTIKTEPNSWTGPVCRMNACIVYRRMLVDKCMYMPGVATTQLVGVTGEAPQACCQKQYSKILINSNVEQTSLGLPSKQYFLMLLIGSTGCVLPGSEQCCYRTVDLINVDRAVSL